MDYSTKILAVVLTVILVTPAQLFLVPQTVHAFEPVEIIGDVSWTGIQTAVESKITALKSTLTSISAATSAAAEVAQEINQYVLMPMAFVMSGQLLKLITASMLAFVAGAINGSGAPQFVTNVQGHLRLVSDNQANAFFVQFSKNSNSPFAASITSSLRSNYLQQTSLAGFFASNRDTLPRYATNANAYLSGDWSKGGIGAWFALTTQDQNNPWTLHQSSQGQLNSMIQGAVSARQQMLAWGQGMLSWCAPKSDTSVASSPTPQVACINEDGTEGTIQTPGSTIKSFLDTTLGSTIRKLEGLGQLGKEVNGILGNIATVMGTVGFAQQIMGGSSGGLSGVISGGPGGQSTLLEYRNSPGFLGVTPTTVYRNAATMPSSGSNMLDRVSQYESAWSTIRGSALAASTTVMSLKNKCTAASKPSVTEQTDSSIDWSALISASTAQAEAAQTAFTFVIAPVLAKADTASLVAAQARSAASKLQTELTATSTSNTAVEDIAALQTMSPTATDLAEAQQEAQSFGTASASPAGSLVVTGGTLVDRMSILSTNAQNLMTVCLPETYALSSRGSDSE